MVEYMKTKRECAACQTPIWEVVGEKLKKSEHYNEIDVKLDNQSNMALGVCEKHTRPKKLDFEVMTEKIHQGWLEELAFGIGDEAWVKGTGLKLNIVGVYL